MNWKNILISSIAFIVILTACQSAKELHYFRSGGNYYRLKINETSFASKARYLSGYFDDKAVDKYFSEMSQPDSGKFFEWVGNEPRGTQLVMILSTNSTTIAEQIGNLASNEELLQTVALMAKQNKIEQGRASAIQIKDLTRIRNNIISAGNAWLDTANVTNANRNIADFLRNLQLHTRDKLDLSNLDSALAKYKTN